MAKGFWKVGGKAVSPLVFGGIGIGLWLMIKTAVEKKAEKDAYKGFAKLFERGATPATSKVNIPAGRTWRVLLKDGRQVRMSSVQLESAIGAKAVKSYSLLRQTI